MNKSTIFKPVLSVNPIAPYLGGKKNLAKQIIVRIDAIPHECYAEPFIGMGGVFLRRKLKPECEVINDFNQELVTLFRILQRHYPQFLDMMKFQLTTRYEFERLVKTNPETLTDLERAARFLYIQRTCFGGKLSGNNFGVVTVRPARFDLTKLVPMLEDLHVRLSGVVIEGLAYDKFILRYDRPHTLFYLDPPYFGHENDYGKNIFAPEDFANIAELLKNIKGRFIMSINDAVEIRKLFANFDIEEVKTTYTAGGAYNTKKVTELLISN